MQTVSLKTIGRQPAKTSQCSKPLPIRRILEDGIKPPIEEFSQLKELDARMHALKFSTDNSRKFSGHKQQNVATITLNRCL